MDLRHGLALFIWSCGEQINRGPCRSENTQARHKYRRLLSLAVCRPTSREANPCSKRQTRGRREPDALRERVPSFTDAELLWAKGEIERSEGLSRQRSDQNVVFGY